MKNKRGNGSSKKTSVLIAVLLVAAASLSPAFTQQDRRPPQVTDLMMADLMKMQGKLISKGRNTQAAGPLKLMTYRLEELSLPQNVTVQIGQKAVEVNKAWRLTIVGGPFPVRALPPVIWIDDVVLGTGAENERLTEISVITFDRSLLREGGAIALSYGENKEARMEVPEKLSLTGTR